MKIILREIFNTNSFKSQFSKMKVRAAIFSVFLSQLVLVGGALADVEIIFEKSNYCAGLNKGHEINNVEINLCEAYTNFINGEFLDANSLIASLVAEKNPFAQYLRATMIRMGLIESDDPLRGTVLIKYAAEHEMIEAVAEEAMTNSKLLMKKGVMNKYEISQFDETLKSIEVFSDKYPDIGHIVKGRLYMISIAKESIQDLPDSFITDAARYGIPEAMYFLAKVVQSRGVTFFPEAKDYEWPLHAANEGVVQAQYEMANGMKFLAENAPESKRPDYATNALKWYTLAEFFGHSEAGQKGKAVKLRLSATQVKTALEWSKHWFVTHAASIDSEIGKAVFWCKGKNVDARKCIQNARRDHFQCSALVPTMYFSRNFQKTKAYDFCRQKK